MAVLLSAQPRIPRNTIILEKNFIASAHLSYDRSIADLSDKVSLMIGGDYVLGVGFGYGSQWIIPEVNLNIFGSRHFLETGLQYAFGLPEINDEVEEGDDNTSPGLRIAYRYQANRGFTFRFTVSSFFLFDPPVYPSIGAGYSL